MKSQFATKLIAIMAIYIPATATFGHVTLLDGVAAAGAGYRATFRVGHGCDGSATTGLRVTLPAGFNGAQPMPKPGWTVSTTQGKLAAPYTSHGKTYTEGVQEISWVANGPQNALPAAFYDEFVLRGVTPGKPGPVWFKVVQTCTKGALAWVETPATGSSTQGMKSPAALLELIDNASAGSHTSILAQMVGIQDAWIRATVQGQKATGAFMKITTKEKMQLVAVESPVAGVAEVHEMKMEGDVMKMRALDKGLELPAGKTVELKPGGFHLMLMDLKTPLRKDTSVPLTLVLMDSKGVQTKTEIKIPVSLVAPTGVATMGASMGAHHGH
jgi:periplasmic copper chaperone A